MYIQNGRETLNETWASVNEIKFSTRRPRPKCCDPIYKLSHDNLTRLSDDNARDTIDLRRTSNLQNILRRAQSFSEVGFTRKIVRSSETVFVNQLITILRGQILARCKSLS